MSKALIDVLIERMRQVQVKGRTPQHDDKHKLHELACYAICFALHASKGILSPHFVMDMQRQINPFSNHGWTPQRSPTEYTLEDRRQDFVKSAALMLAEISRIDRLIEKED